MNKNLHKRLCTILAVILAATLSLTAQNENKIIVSGFAEATNDTDAILEGTQKFDQNGDRCAILKVETTQSGFTFDVGTLGVVDVVEKTGEIWVYVPHGVKRITIRHPQLGTMRDWYFPQPIEKGRTYIMVLTTGMVNTVIEEAVTRQYLVVNADPEDAIVEIDGSVWTLKDGSASKYMNFGNYDYSVKKRGYHDESGIVSVMDSKNTVYLNVKLKPAFGWFKINQGPDTMKGCSLYIDDGKVSIPGPADSLRLPSGTHHISLTKELYKPIEKDIVISDGRTYTLLTDFKPNFSTVEISSDKDAEIWVNGNKMALGNWTGNLEAGTYRFEARKVSHRSRSVARDIYVSSNVIKVSIPSPTPVYGKLRIESDPIGAAVLLDSVEIGQTPLMRQNVLVGDYRITLKKEGYKPLVKSVVIEEGREAVLTSNTMEIGANTICVITSVPSARVLIDGEERGTAGERITVSTGEHIVVVRADGYDEYKKVVQSADCNDVIVNAQLTYSTASSSKLSSSYINLKVGDSYPLKMTNFTGNVSWRSESPGVATVSNSGIVRGVTPGYTYIYAKTFYGEQKCFVVVTVDNGRVSGGSASSAAAYSSATAGAIGKVKPEKMKTQFMAGIGVGLIPISATYPDGSEKSDMMVSINATFSAGSLNNRFNLELAFYPTIVGSGKTSTSSGSSSSTVQQKKGYLMCPVTLGARLNIVKATNSASFSLFIEPEIGYSIGPNTFLYGGKFGLGWPFLNVYVQPIWSSKSMNINPNYNMYIKNYVNIGLMLYIYKW